MRIFRLPNEDADYQELVTKQAKIRSEEILIIILCLLFFITATILSTWRVIVIRRCEGLNLRMHHVCLMAFAVANFIFLVIIMYFAIIFYLFNDQDALFNVIISQFVVIYVFLGLAICRIVFEVMTN